MINETRVVTGCAIRRDQTRNSLAIEPKVQRGDVETQSRDIAEGKPIFLAEGGKG